MKKRAVCLCLCALLLTGAVCGCRYRGDARAEIENELESARAENEAKRNDEAAEQNPASDGAETDNPAPVEAGEPEETQTIKPAYKNDWDGIISSQYTVIGDRYYYHVKAKKTLTDKDGRTHTTGVVAYVYTDLTQGGMEYVCPDPLCSHDDPGVYERQDLCSEPGRPGRRADARV